jgi:hypothetical protein
MTAGETTADEAGSPLLRRQLQERLAAGEGLVLLVPAAEDDLGWTWAQALGAERIYGCTLREQLREWGWRPQSPTITDDELAVLARQLLGQDPQDRGGGGLQPDPGALARVLAGPDEPAGDDRLVLDATIEATGLPPLDADNLGHWRRRRARLATRWHTGASPAAR